VTLTARHVATFYCHLPVAQSCGEMQRTRIVRFS